jgi:hypothetical protein
MGRNPGVAAYRVRSQTFCATGCGPELAGRSIELGETSGAVASRSRRAPLPATPFMGVPAQRGVAGKTRQVMSTQPICPDCGRALTKIYDGPPEEYMCPVALEGKRRGIFRIHKDCYVYTLERKAA